MSWWSRWLATRSGPAAGWDDARWVVLDVEASGLDAAHDRLLAIAAVGVHLQAGHAFIAPGDSFEVVLRQADQAATPDKANILLHGIGVGAQRAGVEPARALTAFADFAGRSPLIAFHAAFDRRLIERAMAATLQRRLANPWLDLEPLAAVLNADVKARALDEWMAHFGIRCAVRHQAAADTLATAELLLALWPAARAQMPTPSFRAACKLAAQRRWVQSG
jgi:DNA polymerase III subunit epsilon